MGAFAILAPASTATSADDRTATHAYIAAYYAFEQTLMADIPGRIAVAETRAGRIEAECPGILAHAPTNEPESPSRETARERGERNLHREQLGELTEELYSAVSPAQLEPEKEAFAAFAARARALRWSTAAITDGVDSYLRLVEPQVEAQLPPPPVCGDIAAWVASGYRRLSSSTKALSAERRLPLLPSSPGRIVSPTSPALIPYEGPAERHLLAAVRKLRVGRFRSLNRLEQIAAGAGTALGIREPERGLFPLHPPPSRPSVVIGHGRTAVGERFTVTFEPAGPEARGCSLSITEGGAVGETFGSPGSRCSFTSHGADASVNCNEGLLTIDASPLPAARTVRLLLSDGRTINSPAILIPARFGGPAGVYHEIVRGPSPIPVSLTEIGHHGRTLRIDRLPAIVECTRHPLEFLPGGIRTLVRGRVPGGGSSFVIEAQRYRFLGRVHLDLKAHVEESSSGAGPLVFSSSDESRPLRTARGRRVFAPEETSGCKPTPYTILFGLLDRRYTVLARTGAGLLALHERAMPASLRAKRVLAWGVFTPPPTELLVRSRTGRTVVAEPFPESGREQVEQCEGEAEPASGAQP